PADPRGRRPDGEPGRPHRRLAQAPVQAHSAIPEGGALMIRTATMSTAKRWRRAAAVALAAVLGVSLTACVSIPSDGPVQLGLSDLQQAERLVQLGASGPSAGDSQEQLVRGFLLAANSSADDYAV